MPSKSQILAAAASVTTILLGGLNVPAQAFSPISGDGRTAAPPRTAAGTASASVRRTALQRVPITAARPAARKVATAEPTPSDLATKANANAPLSILISLDRQQLTLYSGSQPIAHSRVSTGTRGHGTPTGVFSIIQKDRWHRSNLYDDAPMWFMQRITWSGVALHQGIVPNYPASHGCIRLPEAFARQLWGTTKMGVRVIITRGEATPVAISHPNLFMPKKPTPALVMTQAQSLKAAEQAWTFAQLASKTPLVGATMTDLPAPLPSVEPPKPARVLKPGPVSVFISRKEGKLYVRKGFEPVFDMPVTIDAPQEPFGTHVFTAIAQDDENTMRWTAVTAQSAGAHASASRALDRVTIPQDARDQISELLTPGASLIISDQGLGSETGKGTDFIVLTR